MRAGLLSFLLALGACKKEEPAGPSSAVLFESVDGEVLVGLACWDAEQRAFRTGATCGTLAPNGGVVAQLDAPNVTATLGGRAKTTPYEGIMDVRALGAGQRIDGGGIWPADAYPAVWEAELMTDLPDLGYEQRLALARNLGVPGEPHADLLEVALDGQPGRDKLLVLHVDHERDEEDHLTAIGSSGLYLASTSAPTGWVPLFTSQTEVVRATFLDLDRNGRAEVFLALEPEAGGPDAHLLLRVERGNPVVVGRFDPTPIH